MTGAKIHIGAADETGDIGRSLCGRSAVLLGPHGDATCRRCMSAWETRRDDLRGITWDEAIRALAHVLSGPPVSPPPRMTPELWRSMDCRRGELVEDGDTARIEARRITPRAWLDKGRPARALRCQCPACEAEALDLPALDNWHAEQQVRPHRAYDCDFGSRDAALQALLRWRQDGPGARSNTGAVVSRLTESARLGATVQTTVRVREELPTRRADQAADLERFLRRAFAEESERRGLSVDECVEVMLATVADRRVPATLIAERFGLSVAAARSLIAHGRRIFTIEAAASGYIPPPRAETGLLPLIEKRMSEMGEAAE